MRKEEKVRETDEEIGTDIKSLQKKSLIAKIFLFASVAFTFISMGVDQIPQVCMFIGVGIAIVAGGISNRLTKKIKTIAGNDILKKVLEDVFENVYYDPFDRLSESDVETADFGFSYDKIQGNDYVKATYKGLNIEMSDMELISVSTDSDGHDTESTVFQGLWMICDFGKELSADVRVCERSGLGKMLGKGGIKTENEAFNKQFNIRSKVEEEAFYILTPHMMEYIVQMDEKAKARTYLSFLRGGKLHIALDSRRDAFEIKKFMSDVEKIRAQFTGEIRQVTDLIDELRLVDTIFKA